MRALESEPGERLLIEAAQRDPARFAELYENNFVIDPQARPRDLHVLRSLGLGLVEKAIEAVRKYCFEPAMRDSQPVVVEVNVEVSFHLY